MDIVQSFLAILLKIFRLEFFASTFKALEKRCCQAINNRTKFNALSESGIKSIVVQVNYFLMVKNGYFGGKNPP